MKFKTILFASTLALGLGMSSLAQAEDLVIHNNTNYNSTSKINGGTCSSDIHLPGFQGTTYAHTTNTVKSFLVKAACFPKTDDCVADVYMADQCQGPVVATVHFDVNKGVVSAAIPPSDFIFNAQGFTITMSGGK